MFCRDSAEADSADICTALAAYVNPRETRSPSGDVRICTVKTTIRLPWHKNNKPRLTLNCHRRV